MKPHVLTIALLYLVVICVSAKPTETDGPNRPNAPDGPTERSADEIFEKRLGNQNKYDKPHNFACPKGKFILLNCFLLLFTLEVEVFPF